MKFTRLALVLVAAPGAGLWSCRFHYGTVTLFNNVRQPFRSNRFTGETDILWAGIGWRPVTTPLWQIDAAQRGSAALPPPP